MKKINIEYSYLILGIYLLLIGLLLVVLLPVLRESINSILKGGELSSSIRIEITSIILAISTIILVIITAGYAISTKDLLDDQVKSRKIAPIEKVLENIYSPILIALNQFMLNCESLPENRIPDVYNNAFKDFNDAIMNIASKYFHLMNQEIINYYNTELWKAWLQYSSRPDIENYKILNSRVKMFGEYVTKQLNLEKESLNKLQQLGEKMVVNEKQIDSERIKETFSKAFGLWDNIPLNPIPWPMRCYVI